LQLILLQLEYVLVGACFTIDSGEEGCQLPQLLRLCQVKWVLESSDSKGLVVGLPFEHLRHVLNRLEAIRTEQQDVFDLFNIRVNDDAGAAPLLNWVEHVHVLLGA